MIPVAGCSVERRKWFDGRARGPTAILSTRVRLARNLAGARFVGRAREEDLSASLPASRARPSRLRLGWSEECSQPIDELELLDRQFLLERHLVSHDLTGEAKHAGLPCAADESLSVMINEEDHLRIQCLEAGSSSRGLGARSTGWTTRSPGSSRSPGREELGYLTACPTNVGTGMRASVLVHLPPWS